MSWGSAGRDRVCGLRVENDEGRSRVGSGLIWARDSDCFLCVCVFCDFVVDCVG